MCAVRSPDGRPQHAHWLTERERQILGLVARRWSNADIGASIYITPATVKTHLSRLLMKLDARDRAQLIVLAYETGLVAFRTA
jgi:DNA-binding NarL/FixJ family response regulator